jgi:transposase
MTQGACVKTDAWNAQRVVNERYEKTFEKIERHLDRQTTVMETLARQGEQLVSLRRDQEEDRRLLEMLFKHDRDLDAKIAGKADTVPWFKSIPVFAALASLVLAALSWSRG